MRSCSKCLILLIIEGFAANLWFRGEVKKPT